MNDIDTNMESYDFYKTTEEPKSKLWQSILSRNNWILAIRPLILSYLRNVIFNEITSVWLMQILIMKIPSKSKCH